MECNENAVSMPRIGEQAPSFTAVTTQGTINFPEDYKGKWVVLFSHPADFTPICTSEFVTFGALQKDFEDLNCQLVGLSIDGLNSHIAWLRTIREKIEYRGMKNVDIRFPLIEDVKMDVARKYGMLQPSVSDTKAVRAVFFIDPKGVIRAMIYYPLNLGRNFDEMLRVLKALQTIDHFGVATPADWRPGDDIIVSAPGSAAGAKERMDRQEEGMSCSDWFFCTKKLPKEEVEKALGK